MADALASNLKYIAINITLDRESINQSSRLKSHRMMTFLTWIRLSSLSVSISSTILARGQFKKCMKGWASSFHVTLTRDLYFLVYFNSDTDQTPLHLSIRSCKRWVNVYTLFRAHIVNPYNYYILVSFFTLSTNESHNDGKVHDTSFQEIDYTYQYLDHI